MGALSQHVVVLGVENVHHPKYLQEHKFGSIQSTLQVSLSASVSRRERITGLSYYEATINPNFRYTRKTHEYGRNPLFKFLSM
jgi:hypothetical protein